MTGWICSCAAWLMLALTACSTAPHGWQESGGAAHPLVGQIYRVADGRLVSETDLIEAAAAADFVLIGERHDNRHPSPAGAHRRGLAAGLSPAAPLPR